MSDFLSDYLGRQARSLVSNALAPAEAAGGRVIAMLAGVAGFGAVATLCLIGVLIFLSVALDLWITGIAGPVVAALATAGFYLVAGLICLLAAIGFGRGSRKKNSLSPPVESAAAKERGAPRSATPHIAEAVEETVAPFVAILHQMGLKREEVAVRLAAEATKQIGPLALVGIALLAGFLGERALNPTKPPTNPTTKPPPSA